MPVSRKNSIATHPMTKGLPKFNKPPVVETVLGIQFLPLAGFRNAHLGAFWKTLDADWPHVSDASLLGHDRELFSDDRWVPGGPILQLTQTPTSRLWIRNQNKDRMIQVQRDRLCYNWLANKGKNQYPSYAEVRQEFDKAWDSFLRFIEQENLGPVQPDQWEVTYVNHIPRGEVWKAPHEIPRLLDGLLAQKSGGDWGTFESAGGASTFVIADNRGRLHIEFQHTRPETEEQIVLKLTARGPIDDRTDTDAGLNLGHETIVRAFADITGEYAHGSEFWDRTDDR